MRNIKKKLAITAVASMTILSLTGCSEIEKTNAMEYRNAEISKNTVDNIIAVDIPSSQTDGNSLSIITDKRTGVQYIRSYKGGLHVIVDKDGKPLTVDVKGDK